MSDAPAQKSFEESLADLEAVVRDLEDGKTSLETAIARYEQGVALLKACHEMLKVAELRITVLTGPDENGEITLTKTTVQELS
jgi:exodeoxyribonuclease VII small subunit